MKKIPISEIDDHMVLARPLTRSDGKILMASGVKLKSNMAARLQNWGITVAYVEESEGETSEDRAELIKAKLEKLEGVFDGALESPHMRVIFEAVKEHLQKNAK